MFKNLLFEIQNIKISTIAKNHKKLTKSCLTKRSQSINIITRICTRS